MSREDAVDQGGERRLSLERAEKGPSFRTGETRRGGSELHTPVIPLRPSLARCRQAYCVQF